MRGFRVLAIRCARCGKWVKPWRWSLSAHVCKACLAEFHALIREWAAFVTRLSHPHQ
jgi:hypothetical protein